MMSTEQSPSDSPPEPGNLTVGRIRELAVKASVHPRSIEKILLGLPVRGLAGDRARRVLKRAGLLK